MKKKNQNLKLLQSRLEYPKIAINNNKCHKIAMHYWNTAQSAKSKHKVA